MSTKELIEKPKKGKIINKASQPKKTKGNKSTKKGTPPRAEKAVTVEWNFAKENDKVAKDRIKILSELEKKSLAKKAQTKMDI